MGGRHAARPQRKARELLYAEDGTMYAVVKATLGAGRVQVEDSAGDLRVCKVRGSMHKREFVRVNDLVLISLREFETAQKKGDVVWKYTEDEARQLRRYGELQRWTAAEEDADDCVVFDIDVDAV